MIGFKLKEGVLRLDCEKIVQSEGSEALEPKETVEALSLEMFRTRSDEALDNLI